MLIQGVKSLFSKVQNSSAQKNENNQASALDFKGLKLKQAPAQDTVSFKGRNMSISNHYRSSIYNYDGGSTAEAPYAWEDFHYPQDYSDDTSHQTTDKIDIFADEVPDNFDNREPIKVDSGDRSYNNHTRKQHFDRESSLRDKAEKIKIFIDMKWKAMPSVSDTSVTKLHTQIKKLKDEHAWVLGDADFIRHHKEKGNVIDLSKVEHSWRRGDISCSAIVVNDEASYSKLDNKVIVLPHKAGRATDIILEARGFTQKNIENMPLMTKKETILGLLSSKEIDKTRDAISKLVYSGLIKR